MIKFVIGDSVGTPLVYTAIGLMSGTSLDGVDCALVRTDGYRVIEHGPAISTPYRAADQATLKAALVTAGDWTAPPARLIPDGCQAAADSLHHTHLAAIKAVRDAWDAPVDLVGLHGQTLVHRPNRSADKSGYQGWTFQLADAGRLASACGLPVVADFRTADMAAGGEGAPLAPLYHQALLGPQTSPCAVLNLGGVGNITLVDPARPDNLLAFDTGPANALIDDLVRARSNQPYDEGGRIAARGNVDHERVEHFLRDPYFAEQPPKSLDRDHWSMDLVAGMPLDDAAATLTAMTAASVAAGLAHAPKAITTLYVTGGGRLNPSLISALEKACGVRVVPVEDLGWRGDYLEAEAFAFLAVRAKLGLPLSQPGTTGCHRAVPGGMIFYP